MLTFSSGALLLRDENPNKKNASSKRISTKKTVCTNPSFFSPLKKLKEKGSRLKNGSVGRCFPLAHIHQNSLSIVLFLSVTATLDNSSRGSSTGTNGVSKSPGSPILIKCDKSPDLVRYLP